MRMIGHLGVFTFLSLATTLACSSKSTSQQARDGAADYDSGAGVGGNGVGGANNGPGGVGGSAGGGGTSSSGHGGASLPGAGGGGGISVGGSGGGGSGGGGSGGGSGGVAQDAEPADGSRDASGEAPAVDHDAANNDGVVRDGTVVLDLGTTDLGSTDGMAPGCGAVGDPCVGQTGCSSGDSIDIACRSILVCQNGTLRPANLFFLHCGTTSGNACPATQPTEGAACTLDAHTCSYSTGTCSCTTGCAGGVDAGPCQKPTTWHCDQPPGAGCPIQAPQLGLPCANEKVACHYGAYCAQYQITCQNGYWEPYGALPFGGCQ